MLVSLVESTNELRRWAAWAMLGGVISRVSEEDAEVLVCCVNVFCFLLLSLFVYRLLRVIHVVSAAVCDTEIYGRARRLFPKPGTRHQSPRRTPTATLYYTFCL